MTNKFEGQTVIITGGSNGIGKGIADAFGKEGAIVCIADIDENKGKEAQRLIEETGGKAVFFKTDVRNEENLTELMDYVTNNYGKIDILINNAGVSKFKPFFCCQLK